MSLALVKSPIFDNGSTVSAAVATLSQLFFKFQRNDMPTGVFTVTNVGGKARFAMASYPSGTIVGDYFFIADDETTNLPLPKYAGLHRITNIAGAGVFDTNTNYISASSVGIVTYQRTDPFTLIVTLQADNEAYQDNTIQYKIPFNNPVYSIDLKDDVKNLFVLDNNTYSEISITITAINNLGNPVTGTAIGTYDIQLFESFLPKGYVYGASLVGFVLRTTILGLLATRLRTPRIYEGFQTFIYWFEDTIRTGFDYLIHYTYLDINKNPISTSQFYLPYNGLGIQKVGINPTGAPSGSKFLKIDITLDDVPLTPLINPKVYEIYCLNKGEIIVSWQNGLGATDYWHFNIKNESSFDNTSGLSYEKGGVFDWKDNVDTIVTQRGSTIQKYRLTASGINELDLPALNEIFTSPDVNILTYELNAYAKVQVNVGDAVSVPFRFGQIRNHEVSFVASLPADSAFLTYLLAQYE